MCPRDWSSDVCSSDLLKNNWLRLFVRNNKGNRSPLRHLLYLQYLDISPKELFNTKEVVGRISNTKVHTPKFDIHKRREKWLQLIKENKGDNREELKEKGKGLHTWIFRYDRERSEERRVGEGDSGQSGGERG